MWLMLSDSSFEIGPWILLAGPVAGAAVYWLLFQFYRNTNKSHKYEHETRIDSKPPTGSDTKVRSIRKTRESRTSGANGSRHRQRVRRMG